MATGNIRPDYNDETAGNPDDQFYSATNEEQLKKSDDQYRAGQVIEKSMEELESLEDK